jgi:hypothetical protein
LKRKIVAALVAPIMIFGVAACGDDTNSEPQKVVTVTPQVPDVPDSPEPLPTDEQFVQVVKENTDQFDDVSTSTLAGLAGSVCTAWNNGNGPLDIVKVFTDEGYDQRDSAFFVGAATAAYCPEYDPENEKLQQKGGAQSGDLVVE